MSRNSGGIYTLVPIVNPVQPDTIISTGWAVPTLNDIAQALTESLDRNGRGSMLAPLIMSGFPINSLGPAQLPTDAPTAKQVRDLAFTWLTSVSSDVGGNIIVGSALLTAPSVNGTMVAFVPDKQNTGAVTLNVNGSGAVPVLSNGVALVAGTLSPLKMIVAIYASGSYNITSGANVGVNSITSADPQMMSFSQPSLTNYLLTPHANVANGTVKLDAAGRIPPTLLNIEGMILLGIFSAVPGTLPPDGNVSGQYYLINPPGNLNLYVTNGAGGWVQQVVPVDNGDAIVWVDTSVEPKGWYRLIRANANVAGDIVNNATPSFVATDLQSWIDQADAPAGFLLSNGTRRNTGTQRGGGWTAGGGGAIAGNLINAAGWTFLDAAGWGWGRISNPAGGFTDFLSTTTSSGAGAAATLQDFYYGNINYGALIPQQFGVGGIPRNPGGVTPFHFDLQGPGTRRLVVYDQTSQNTLKLVATSVDGNIDCVMSDAAGGVIAQPNKPFNVRIGNGAGGVRNAMTFKANGSVQVGDPSQPSPGALLSTLLNAGTYTGPVDFAAAQTVRVNAGSSITAVSLANGQVGRIMVVGNGAITLPANVKLPRGGAVYGTFGTVIGLFYDGGSAFLASFTPYD